MKIAVVCDVLGKENNGTSIAAMNLIRSLKDKGHEVRIICPDEDKAGTAGYFIVPHLKLIPPLARYVEKVGVTIALADERIIHDALKDVDEVHIMTPFVLGNVALRIARKLKKPVTAGFHCQAENLTSHLFLMNIKPANDLTYKTMYDIFYKHVDGIHYPTQFIRDVFESHAGPTPGYVISNGVNECFKKMEAAKPAEFKDKFIILSIGRFGKEKSQHVIIEAIERSPYKDRIQLILAGAGPLEEKLRDQGKVLPNPPMLKFFSRDELLKLINYSDLYVHAAEVDLEAIACLEAISCGLVPVIADSPRCATKGCALEENNLFKVNDADDLCRRISYWLEHPEEKAVCSTRYQNYTRQFEQGRCMNMMEQMIKDAAGYTADGSKEEA